MFPSPSILSSLVHVIFGVGFPVALQWNVTVVFSMTIWLEGLVVKLVSTEKVINDDQNDNVNDKDIYSQNLAKQFSLGLINCKLASMSKHVNNAPPLHLLISKE